MSPPLISTHQVNKISLDPRTRGFHLGSRVNIKYKRDKFSAPNQTIHQMNSPIRPPPANRYSNSNLQMRMREHYALTANMWKCFMLNWTMLASYGTQIFISVLLYYIAQTVRSAFRLNTVHFYCSITCNVFNRRAMIQWYVWCVSLFSVVWCILLWLECI